MPRKTFKVIRISKMTTLRQHFLCNNLTIFLCSKYVTSRGFRNIWRVGAVFYPERAHVFEYFLGEFALAEGKKGGQFYTPRSVVELLIEMLEPYNGRVFDP